MAEDAITDTSTLINFLRVSRVDLLVGLSAYRFLVTDHVRAEVTDHYPAQLANLNFAILAGHLGEVTLIDPAELTAFAELKKHRLGDGECAAIAAASSRKMMLAIDDIRARKRAAAYDPQLVFRDTVSLVVEAIHNGLLTVDEADAIKADWEVNHRFRLKFASFIAVI